MIFYLLTTIFLVYINPDPGDAEKPLHPPSIQLQPPPRSPFPDRISLRISINISVLQRPPQPAKHDVLPPPTVLPTPPTRKTKRKRNWEYRASCLVYPIIRERDEGERQREEDPRSD